VFFTGIRGRFVKQNSDPELKKPDMGRYILKHLFILPTHMSWFKLVPEKSIVVDKNRAQDPYSETYRNFS
jgi:hypothetical protein